MLMQSAEDRELSPYTGWTRAHWEELHARLVRGMFRHASPGRAHVPYPAPKGDRRGGSVMEVSEGYGRTFFMNGPFLHQSSDGIVEFEGERYDVGEFYRQGLINGTDPDHPEYWGDPTDYSPAIVQGAAIAMNLYFARQHVWDPLAEAQKQRVEDYFYRLGMVEPWGNNWTLFCAMMHAMLKRFGRRHNQRRMDELISIMDNQYFGDGWYRDGEVLAFDYYNAWVIHPYFLIFGMIDPDSDHEFMRVLKGRTRQFTEHFKYFFGANGAYPSHGRSLIYRWAAVSVFPVAELCSCSAVPPGQARRICSGNIKFFVENGAVNEDDYLSMGYLGEYVPVCEGYSGTQSPYWAAKAWWAFLLPPDSAFWTDPEQPNEVEKGDFVHAISRPGMLLQGRRDTGQVNLYANSSHVYVPRRYNNICVSTHFGFDVREKDDSFNVDNCLATTDDEQHYHLRRLSEHRATADRFTACSYYPEENEYDNLVHTCVVLKDDYHVRIHRVNITRPTQVVEGGTALPYNEGEPDIECGDDWTWASHEGRTVFLKNLHGWDEIRPPEGWLGGREGNNLYGNYSVTSTLRTEAEFSGKRVLVSLSLARAAQVTPDELNGLVSDVGVEGEIVTITFSDGEKVLVQPARVKLLDTELNGVPLKGPIMYARASADGSDSYVFEQQRARVQVKEDSVKPVGRKGRALRDKHEKLVDDVMSGMSVEEKIGTCMTHAWRGSMITPSIVETIEKLHAGALRIEPFGTEGARPLPAEQEYEEPEGYFKVAETHFTPRYPAPSITADEYARRLNRLKEIAMNRPSGVPLHVGTDFEGDWSHDFAFDGISMFPASMGITAGEASWLAYVVGRYVAWQLSAIGVDMIHSPVCDVNNNPDNPVINIRSYSDDPQTVATYAVQNMLGLEEGGVISVAKHFPGHGDTGVDSHRALPTVHADRARLDSVELVPFRRMIDAGVRAVMPAHACYPALHDSDLPATLSRVILQDFLRGELGYEGVIVTDAMGMGAISRKWGVPTGCAMALKAGVDILLLKADNETRSRVFFEVKRWVDDGRIAMEELDDRVRRVLMMKAAQGLFENGGIVDPDGAREALRDPETRKGATDAARKAMTVLRDRDNVLPLSRAQKVMIIEQLLPLEFLPNDMYCHPRCLNEAMLGNSLNVVNVDTEFCATDEQQQTIMSLLDEVDAVVMTNHVFRVEPENNTDLVRAIAKSGKPLVVITNSPYPTGATPAAGTVVCTYSMAPPSLRAAADLVYGIASSRGSWPLTTMEKPTA